MRGKNVGLLLCAVFLAQSALGEIFRLECSVGEQDSRWKEIKEDWASQGTFIKAAPGHFSEEASPMDISLSRAGRYTCSVRYWAEKDKRSNFGIVVRNSALELVHFEKVDWGKMLPSEKPYEPGLFPEESGPAWHNFTFTAESPGDYRLSLLTILYRGPASWRQVDCILISETEITGHEAWAAETIAAIPSAPGPEGAFTVPHTSAYAGLSADPFQLGMINCGSILQDPVSQVYLGFNRDHNAALYAPGTIGEHSGFQAMSSPFSDYQPDLQKKYPSPEGRFVNADGEVGRSFSLHFDSFWDEVNTRAIERVKTQLKNNIVDQVSVSGEWGGLYDYSDLALESFRAFLKTHYQDIDRLNTVWRTDFADWAAVRPPKQLEDNPTAYYDFQEFSGNTFAGVLAKRAELVRQHAPTLPVTTQLSNLNIFGAKFKQMKPMDFEEIFRTVYRGQGWFGWDGYCADDYMGAEIDFLDSFADGVPLINHETNTHTDDPDILSRTCWTMVGKGLKGIYLFMFQEGLQHDSYPKWALLNGDFSHKDKLGSASDLVQEIHRFEPLLTTARRAYATKPVYVYYSRLDSLHHGPLLSSWSEGANSPYRVYELLRGAGYPVRYITPMQIAEGDLAGAGALVLSQSERIPAETRTAIIAWVENGGVALADMLPGIQDRNGKSDLSLMHLFGVEPEIEKGGGGSTLALQESSQGYGEVTINAVEIKDIPSSVFEIWQQHDSEHPVLSGIAPYTLSGYGRQKVTCIDGQVIGMTFGGVPGIVINTPGKGKTFYLAGMLGSIYGGSCSRYEFDDAHSGNAPARLIKSFLSWAGASAQSQVLLPEKIARKVRVENPLVDARGNVMFNMVSFNDGPLNDFTVEVKWPENLSRPTRFLAITDHSRALHEVEVRFDNDWLSFTMPGFSTYGALVGLKEFGPVIALESTSDVSGQLTKVAPGGKLQFTARVCNMSERPLATGSVALTLLPGWTCKQMEFKIGELAPWTSQEFTFKVTAPEFCTLRRARPVSLRFKNSEIESTPATAMIWFN